jgi:phenylalanyl-tRNA synthetase beta chain
MNASYTWLRDFTDFALTPTQLRDVITARAATVDDVVSLRGDLADIVVARVVEAAPHPDSDHLSLTKVDAGTGELLDVVCGAPNVTAGEKYPFAPVGATLPGGLKIERRKIRGQSSTGMLCSARELGLGSDHAGILALATDAKPGTPFLQAYPAGDTRLVIDVLPNRPDLLSHEGVAREIAAYTGEPLRRPTPHDMVLPIVATSAVQHSGTVAGVRVSVDGSTGTPLYVTIIIRGVRVAPSPEWLRQRLEGAGVRPINNVVDVTNYMLHGYGQPMHAFDLSKLAGPAIEVRHARAGEKITTLDGVERTLRPSMTVIADAERAQAIAGIIGGNDSAVSDATTDILLEVAVFDPRGVRRTRRTLGLSTDASYRFERGVDSAASEELARHAAGLIVALAGGTVEAAIAVGTPAPPHAAVRVRLDRLARVLGEKVAADECTRLLASVGFAVKPDGEYALSVQPPSWRADVTIEADVAEEIARLRGYDSFPSDLRPFRVGSAPDAASYAVTRRVTEAMVHCGLLEVRPMPFVADSGDDVVRITNPLAESEANLRTSVLQSLARRVEHNFAHMTRSVRLFEVGVVFARDPDGGALPVERTMAAAAITGDRRPAHFADPKPEPVDLWDARWIAERAAAAAYGEERVAFEPAADGAGWTLVLDGAPIGAVRELTVDAPVWASPVFGIELDVTAAFGVVLAPPGFRALPSTPAAEFDLALVIPDGVTAADVRRVVTKTAGELLESLVPFDEFRGRGVGDGFRSVAWRLTFRHPERTLREKEIEGRRAGILRALESELGVRPRAS